MKSISSPSIWNFRVNIDYELLKKKIETIINTTQIIKEEEIDLILDKLENETTLRDAKDKINHPEYDYQSLLNILQIRKKIKISDGKITKIVLS
jgi:hypothetical protein